MPKTQFARSIAKATASDLMEAFPGMTKSTAYSWLSGDRQPPRYMRPIIRDHLLNHIARNPKP